MKNFSMYVFEAVLIISASICIEYTGDFILDLAGNIVGIAVLVFIGIIKGIEINGTD